MDFDPKALLDNALAVGNGALGYLVILALTFFEGETVVIVAAVLAYQGKMNPFLVGISGCVGSFLGDQLWFAVGRHYGTPLLNRWPELGKKIDWAFRMVRKYQTLYILGFRFVYGVRNVSPFVIAMSGVSRLRFIALNFIAASVWAATFTAIGYFSGQALDHVFGEHQTKVLLALAGVGALVGIAIVARRYVKRRNRKAAEAAGADPAESAATTSAAAAPAEPVE